MKTKRIATGLAVLMFASLFQGCAVFYKTETTNANGSVDRQFGLFDGCLPLYHYRSVKSPTVPPP